MCKVYAGYCDTSEIEHGLCVCMVDNPLAQARGLSLRTGAPLTCTSSLSDGLSVMILFNSIPTSVIGELQINASANNAI